jgi:hypothetical protein
LLHCLDQVQRKQQLMNQFEKFDIDMTADVSDPTTIKRMKECDEPPNACPTQTNKTKANNECHAIAVCLLTRVRYVGACV